ncbi:MAG: hypothetical protein JW857_07795 [Bacteroidales bacterium]|nr:hypothetical protein [Bacteroidales bacterium]
MFYTKNLTIFLLFFLLSTIGFAQNSIDDTDIYGLNPIVYNGEVYNYFPGVGVLGHQYFDQETFTSGCIHIRGTKYDNVLLNYDILNQELILKYTDQQGANRLLKVSKAWLQKFKIGDEEFSFITSPENKKLIVQIVQEGTFQLSVFWSKKLVADINFVSEHYVFDKKHRTLFIAFKNKLIEYKSSKTIMALLSKAEQEKAKNFMKINKIKSRTSSLDQIGELIAYCNTLVQ